MSGQNIVPTREGYDRWSAIYDGDGNPLVALEQPEVDGLLGEVGGRAIADVGCGTGRHALRLATRGARVTAIDFSPGMLSQARAKVGAEAVTFIEHDLAKPLPLPAASFDRVLCCLVIDHISDLEGLFRELLRVCRPEGRVILSVMHPAMMLKGVQARFVDPATGERTYPQSCTHLVSDYVMAALRCGARIDHLGEHPMTRSLAERLPRGEPYVGWPMLLMMELAPG